MKRSSRPLKVLAVLVSVIFAGFAICPAGFAQAPVAAGIDTQVVKVEKKMPLPKPGNVSVNFKDVEIITVLHYLSEVSGVDIIPSPEVTGRVTMRLRDKPWEVALDIIARNYDYAYFREGDIIRVMPKGKMRTDTPVTEVLFLSYIIQGAEPSNQNITQLLTAIASIIDVKAGENATYIPSANAIVVTAIPARISSIRDMIDKVDTKTPQIMIEAKVVEVQLSDDERLGIDWNLIITAAGARRPTTFPWTNKGLMDFLPGQQREYYAERGVEGTDEAAGFPWWNTGNLFDPRAAETANAIFSYGTLDFTQFQAVLRAIDERTNTNILSAPRVTTLNNQKAVIRVTNNLYLQKQQKTTDTAAVVTVEFENEAREVGVILEVTPHVNDKGEIAVDLKPQVSSDITFEELQVSGAANTVALRYNTREADTQVMVSNGETIFIGGLITENVAKTVDKFPILGDLLGGVPYLGKAFRYEGEETTKVEIVFFVTVHIVGSGYESIVHSGTVAQYEKQFPNKPLKPPVETGSAAGAQPVVKDTGIVKTGKLKVTEHELMTSTAAPAEDKRYKPFLDFRKKKE